MGIELFFTPEFELEGFLAFSKHYSYLHNSINKSQIVQVKNVTFLSVIWHVYSGCRLTFDYRLYGL